MIRFRTEISPKPSPFLLNLQQPLLSLGSCFADVIGARLHECKFRVKVNPFGTLFHPFPVANLLKMAITKQEPTEDSYLYHQQRWLNYHLHSSINAPSRQGLQQLIQQRLGQVRDNLQQAQALILTLGTSFVYELQQPFLTVANCHKQPQKFFNKRLTGTAESLQALEELWQLLQQHNPSLKLILTLSPVRHQKDGLEENAVSKAMLRVVCHQLSAQYPHQIYYFPSYELLMDDLRDYRFYREDLLHPTAVAEQYVWEKFTSTLLDREAQAFVTGWEPLHQALNHRPFNPTSLAHRQFLQNTLKKIEALAPQADVSAEIQKLREQLQHVSEKNQPPQP